MNGRNGVSRVALFALYRPLAHAHTLLLMPPLPFLCSLCSMCAAVMPCHRPAMILEFNSAIGFTSFVILRALADNDFGHLVSVDTFRAKWPWVLDKEHVSSRWTQFVGPDIAGNLARCYDAHAHFDYVHVGTCHQVSDCPPLFCSGGVGLSTPNGVDTWRSRVCMCVCVFYSWRFCSIPCAVNPSSQAECQHNVVEVLERYLKVASAARPVLVSVNGVYARYLPAK
jgi:hypothetical protein